MLGCFGQRKKKGNNNNSSASKSPIDRSKGEGEASAVAPTSAPSESTPKPEPQSRPPPKPQQVTQQLSTTTAAPAVQADTGNSTEVIETVTVARSHSLHQHAPSEVVKKQQTVTVKKAATLGRYDFLKKYDSASNSDRWSSLKLQYLAPKDEEDHHQDAHDGAPDSATSPKQPAQLLSPLDARPPPKPKSPLGPGVVRSLPRQFSPPSTVVSPVKFSQWFHERKSREDEARRECQDREEKMQMIIEGPTQRQVEDAAVKIQAGYKGFKARRELKELREKQRLVPAAAAAEADSPQGRASGEGPTVPDALEADRVVESAEATIGIQSPGEQDDLQDSLNPKSQATDEEKRSEAAVKIQAGFRGMQARREVADLRKRQESSALAADEAAGAGSDSSADAAPKE